jgi:amino acid transporter
MSEDAVGTYQGGELTKGTNWMGAFAVGLAGTILVTGVTGPVLAGAGSAGLIEFFVVTCTGWLLCMFTAEMAAMLPDRTGGCPAYAYFAFRERFPRSYPIINGVTSWMYWLGWWPVMAVNNILIGGILATLFNVNISNTIKFLPGAVPIPVFTLIIATVICVLLFIPSYLGIRLGAGFAITLAVLSMVPLTFLAISPVFHPSVFHAANIWPLVTPGGHSFWSGHTWLIFVEYTALLTWNVIAMEAAACYIGECRNPGRDAPIAMNLEGGYGVFIYTVIPLVFLGVLGLKAVAATATNPGSLFGGFMIHVFHVSWFQDAVDVVLVIALLLSSLNAIMGPARSLYQIALDGDLPKIFTHVNKHNVPDFSMGLNVLLNIVLVIFGAPAVIYIFSNVGYVGSFVPVLVGYYFLRRWRPNLHRPYRLPEWMKYVALLVAAFYFLAWAWGIPYCSAHGCAVGSGNELPEFFLGWLVVLAWFPLWWWRKYRDRKTAAAMAVAAAPAVVTGAGPAVVPGAGPQAGVGTTAEPSSVADGTGRVDAPMRGDPSGSAGGPAGVPLDRPESSADP